MGWTMRSLALGHREFLEGGVRLGIFAGAWMVALTVIGAAVILHPNLADAQTYWRVWHVGPYPTVPYPPPALLLFAPAALLPLPAFLLLWQALLVAAGVWLLWPLPVRLRLPLALALAATSAWGNMGTLLAVPLTLAPRRPAAWSVLAWTKITPAVGVVALVRQRRWRDTALVAMPSVVLGVALLIFAPGLVAAWFDMYRHGTGIGNIFLPQLMPFVVPIAVRIPVAAAVAWLGASRPWTLAVAATIATPDLSLATCGILAAGVRLGRVRAG